jgi:hypothetical protein
VVLGAWPVSLLLQPSPSSAGAARLHRLVAGPGQPDAAAKEWAVVGSMLRRPLSFWFTSSVKGRTPKWQGLEGERPYPKMANQNGRTKGVTSRTRLFASERGLHSISQRCVRRIRCALTRTRLSPSVEVGDLVHDPPPEFPKARAAAYRSELLQRSRAQIEMRTSLRAVQIRCRGRCQVLGHPISVPRAVVAASGCPPR